MSPVIARSAVGAVVALVALIPGEARAEEEVRIAISSGRATVTLEGDGLAVFDSDTGDPIGAARREGAQGRVRVVVGQAREALAFSGDILATGARRAIFEAPAGVRVDGRLFLGRVSVQLDRKTLTVINRLPLETYLLGIIGSEMNTDWPADALKAQAVAARTYAMQRRMMMRAADRPYDLESTVISQVYTGADRITPSVVDAVVKTRGEVLSHRHRLVEALFHSTCGGLTVSAKAAFGNPVPYLEARPCGWCRGSARYRWSAKKKLPDIGRSLQRAKLIRGKLERLTKSMDSSEVVARAGGKTVRIPASKVRSAVGFTELYSSRFEAKTERGFVLFAGRGFGHGVGLCQWGAHGLASEGKDYREILSHYYQGAEVKRIY